MPLIVNLNQTSCFNIIIKYDKIELDALIINYEFLSILVILEESNELEYESGVIKHENVFDGIALLEQ
jgi:hypothetical protein